jgi:hypothetical protein
MSTKPPDFEATSGKSIGVTDHDAKRLNVVFHGMFAYVIWPDHVEVMAPQEEDHVYKAGAWGRERRLKEGGAYTLEGVRPGTEKLAINPRENLVLSQLRTIDRSVDALFFSLRMPLPHCMTGLRRVRLDPQKQLFRGEAARDLSLTMLPLIQVLTYVVDDFSAVHLDPNHTWRPDPASAGTANLHIWAESDSVFTAQEKDHPIHGFQQLVRLFPGLELQLLYSTGAPPEQPIAVGGMQVWEQATLRERSQLMYGVPNTSGEDDSRGAEITNCLSLIVQND